MKPPKIILRSPKFDDSKIELNPEISHLGLPFNGSIGSSKGDEYEVNKNIIELLGMDIPPTTIAQSSNFLSLTADAYEDYWRNYSVKLISGEDFSIEDEKNRISEWFQPVDGESYLDLGCSTALYARKIAQEAPKSSVVAAHLSRGVLLEDLGTKLDQLVQYKWALPVHDNEGIQGWVMHIDHFGNLITNVTEEMISHLKDGSPLKIYIGNTILQKIVHTFSDVDPGEPAAIIGSSGHLEVVVNSGNASEMLSANKGTPISILFGKS